MDSLDQAVAPVPAVAGDVPATSEICLVCYGKGKLIVSDHDKFSGVTSPIALACGRCNGAGRVNFKQQD